MARALTNIISNAQKYGQRIILRTESFNAHVNLIIEDDGPGIPEAQHEEVFKPFYRMDSARNQNIEGTGLGLAIARDIIRSHGGKINLGQSPLGGLEVRVILPL